MSHQISKYETVEDLDKAIQSLKTIGLAFKKGHRYRRVYLKKAKEIHDFKESLNANQDIPKT